MKYDAKQGGCEVSAGVSERMPCEFTYHTLAFTCERDRRSDHQAGPEVSSAQTRAQVGKRRLERLDGVVGVGGVALELGEDRDGNHC